jgi:hypothetical protein
VQQDKPRLLLTGEAEALFAEVAAPGAGTAEETEGLPFAGPAALPDPPGEPPPLRVSRKALAPKLMRRAKGVAGMLEDTLDDMDADAGAPPGSSSNGDSSTEAEFALETLSARFLILLYGDVWVPGSVERPKVVIDRRLGGFG